MNYYVDMNELCLYIGDESVLGFEKYIKHVVHSLGYYIYYFNNDEFLAIPGILIHAFEE